MCNDSCLLINIPRHFLSVKIHCNETRLQSAGRMITLSAAGLFKETKNKVKSLNEVRNLCLTWVAHVP